MDQGRSRQAGTSHRGYHILPAEDSSAERNGRLQTFSISHYSLSTSNNNNNNSKNRRGSSSESDLGTKWNFENMTF